MGHDHDRVLLLQIKDQFFDFRSGDRSNAGGSSINSTSGRMASARAMQRRCCPPDKLSAELFNRSLTPTTVLHLSTLLQLDRLTHGIPGQAIYPDPYGDVVKDRLRKRVRLLENHSNTPT